MKFFCTAGALTLAIALVPAFKAWPTTPSEETPAGDEEFELLGRIEFPCGSEIEEVCTILNNVKGIPSFNTIDLK